MSLLSVSVVYAKGEGRRDGGVKMGVWIGHCLLACRSVFVFVLRLLLVAQLFRGEGG